MNSDSDREKTSASPFEEAPNEVKDAKPGPQAAWSSINRDLKTALNTWEELSEQMANKMSPEEEQLDEVRKLLRELKHKLKDFSE